MTKKHWRIGLIVLVIGLMVFGGAMVGLAVNGWDGSVVWTEQGADDDPACDKIGDGDYRTEEGWIHWNFTGAGDVTAAQLVLGGSGGGYTLDFPDETFDPPRAFKTGNLIQWFTPYFDLETLTAIVYYDGETGAAEGLVISDYCPGVACEDLTVTKTAVTSFKRTHDWKIEKWVETKDGHTVDDCIPKIWLYADGTGDEWAKWKVKVTYLGYEDSDFNVSGTITIENTGTCDAVITGYEDLLGGEDIDVDWDDWDGESDFTLEVGECLYGTYSEDVATKICGKNVVTVYTEENPEDGYSAEADIVWGDPTTELYAEVKVFDKSDLFGWEYLGKLKASDYCVDGFKEFSYCKDFEYADYGPDNCGAHCYENTAFLFSKDECGNKVFLGKAKATLKVNVQCHIWDSAWAKGDENAKAVLSFCDAGFSNWGWTNQILPGTYNWDLWAGAAQCDTSKGTLVGSVDVVYDEDGYVNVTFNVDPDYLVEDPAVYAGYDEFPTLRNGNETTAPGQYVNNSPFDGSAVWVIAHVNVGYPDPDFGPTQ